MSDEYKGKGFAKLLLKSFKENPCMETARPVFIECRNSNTTVPDEVLDCIKAKLEIDDNKMLEEHQKIIKLKNDKIETTKRVLLRCALKSNTLKKCFNLYREKTGEALEDTALRNRLERHLDQELAKLIESQFRDGYPYLIPTTLIKKIAFYKFLESMVSE
jgi:hypothetical protein